MVNMVCGIYVQVSEAERRVVLLSSCIDKFTGYGFKDDGLLMLPTVTVMLAVTSLGRSRHDTVLLENTNEQARDCPEGSS